MCDPWYLYQMVTQNMLRTHEGKYGLSEKNLGFVTALDLITYLREAAQKPILVAIFFAKY